VALTQINYEAAINPSDKSHLETRIVALFFSEIRQALIDKKYWRDAHSLGNELFA